MQPEDGCTLPATRGRRDRWITASRLPLPRCGKDFISLFITTRTVVSRPLAQQALASVLAPGEEPGRRSALCPCFLEPAAPFPTMPSSHPEQTSGEFLAVQGVLLYLKMRSTWKLPFLCCKEETLLPDGPRLKTSLSVWEAQQL